MDEIQKLYDALVDKNLYSKTVEDFKVQFEDEEYKKKVFDAVVDNDLFSKDFNTFNSKYSLLDDTNSEEVSIEDEEIDNTSDFLSQYISKDPETQISKDLSYFEKDWDKEKENVGNVWFGGKGLEESIVPKLNKKFNKWGFVFEQDDITGDAVKVSSTKDPNVSKSFNIDNPSEGMRMLKAFIEKNKSDNAIFSENIDELSITDDYVKNLVKATKEKDEEKKNELLTSVSRKIYASEGVNYDEIKNLNQKIKDNESEDKFVKENLVVGEFEKIDPRSGGVISYYNVEDYKPTNEEIEKYSNIFNKDGSLKINPKKYIDKLKQENSNILDITAHESIYKAKQLEAKLFNKFKNKETSKILESSEVIKSKSSNLNKEFIKVTGRSIANSESVNLEIDKNIKYFDGKIKELTEGVGLNELSSYKPKTQEEADSINNIIQSYSTYYSNNVKPVIDIYSQYSSLSSEAEQLDDIGNTINTMLNFDGLINYRGQYEDNAFNSVINNARKGWSQGVVNRDFVNAAYGITDVTDDEQMASVSKKVAEQTALQKGILTSEVWERYSNASSVAEKMRILKTNPTEVFLSLFGNSMSMFTSTGSRVFFPIVGGTTVAGAALGSAGGPGGTLAGGISGASKSLLAWQTITAFNMEMGSAFSEELTKNGYDLSDANQVILGLRDKKVTDAAIDRGTKRGIPIALANFLGGAVANGFVSPLATTGRQIAGQFAKGALIEPIFEGAGEGAAQLAADGKLVGTEIFDEMIGGMPGSQSNIAVTFASNQFTNKQANLASKLEDINYISENNFGYNDVRAFTNRLLGKKKITASQAKKIVENARIVDETNSIMRDSPKFVSGKNKNNARKRISDLIQHRNLVEKSLENAKGDVKSRLSETLGSIESEINEIASTGKTLAKSDVKTVNDLANLYRRNLSSGLQFINKKLGKDNYEAVILNEETKKQLKKDNPELYEAINELNIDYNTSGFIMPNVKGKNYIVVNEENINNSLNAAIAAGDTSGFSVMSHEILHAVLSSSFENKEIKDLSIELEKYVLESDDSKISAESKKRIKARLLGYEKEYGGKDKRYYEEVFTTLSDEMQDENIDYNRQDKSFWLKIADTINDYIYKNKSSFDEVTRGSLKIKTAEEAFNFIKDYNKVFNKNVKISKDRIKTKSPIVEETEEQVVFSKKASDNVQNIYREQGVSGALDIINEFKPIVNKIVQRRSEAPGFDRQLLTDEIETGKGGILDLITKYKPDSGVPLAAFINKYLPVRAIEASRRVLGEVFESDISERVDIVEPVSKVEEVEVTEKTKEPTNLRRALDIKEGGDLYNKVKEVVAKTFGTKIPAATDPAFKKKLQDTYASELMSDIKDLMGKPSSDKYKTFLQEYGEQIYDLLPQDILNKSYQDFIVEKKKNLSPTEVDKAISDGLLPGDTPRTSGPSLFTKESFNQQKWVDYHLAPTKGRPASKQTQLAQTIAKELGKDATLEVLEDPKVFERFTAVEEIQGRKVTKETKPKIAEKIKREPGVKFSKSVEKIINIRNLFELETKGIDKLLKSYGINETFNLKTEQGIKDFIVALKNDLLPLMPKDFWFGNKAVLTPSYYVIGASQNNPQLKQKYKDLYNNVYIPAINEIRNDANQRYGKPIKGVKDYSIAAYSTIFKNSKTIENNLENGKIKNWNKKVELIHREMWNRFNKSISKNKKTASVIGNYLKFTGSATSHWHKLGAQFVGYSKDITGNRFEYEHAMPATSAYLYLIDAALSESDFITTYDLTMNNYKLIALDKAMDKKLTSAKLQRKMPDDWSVINNFWWQRYFNDIVSNQDGGIDPNSIIGLEGKTFSEMFNVDASGNSTTIEVEKLKSKAKNVNVKNLSNNVVNFSKTDTNQDVIGYAKTIDEALAIARDLNAPVKKIRVFDFDDTLAQTKSIVFYTKADGTEGKLTAEEFAEKGANLVSEGAVMDFSDFNIVRDGKRGPLFDIAKKIEKARGTEDVFVLTARAPESQQAIHEFLKSEGLNIPIENITGLGNSTGAAKANWIVDKAADGYNDFYFADDAYQNVKAVQDALDQIDVKSEVQQAKIKFSKTLNEDFNKIIENTTGVAADKVYSKAKAQVRGANKGRFKFFIPYSAEDFLGLIYPTLSKGNLGDAQMAWYKKHILDPYTRAMESLSADRLQLMEDFKALKKALDVPKNLRKVNDSGFTNEQAVRVYLWNKMGYDIPGLSKTDLKELTTIVESDGLLKAFADQILNLTKGDGYSKPTNNWLVGTITTDLVELINTTKRSKYLEEWQQNIDEVYSQDNLNKLEAIYGSKYVEALKSTLSRMKSGKNRAATGNRLSNRILDYINGSVGAIMFFNTRSAVLQTISSINFVNWSFNNPLMAGKAFANQPQYWKDFKELMNSDYLVDRRNGLKLNISESEIADAAATSKNKAKAALNYLLQKGFLPTQMADSFAIASGGATFYRNRINDLIKNKGLTEAEAKAQAMLEFRQIAETSQQSSDPSKISQQQSSDVGRLLLAFANTPMQYARMQKRAAQDLINGRGDAKSNISKIIYYGFVQNLIFNALQQAVNLLGFGDDEEKEEEEYKKKMKIANGMADSLLRGLGIGGQAVSVGKNFLLDIYERSERKRPEYVDAMWKLMQFSPPISSKISKLKQAAWHFDSKKRREKIFEKGFSLDNPAYEAGAKVISATTNLPLDRVYSKVNNIEGSLAEDLDVWQRLAMLGGWPEWQINPGKTKKQKETWIKSDGWKKDSGWKKDAGWKK